MCIQTLKNTIIQNKCIRTTARKFLASQPIKICSKWLQHNSLISEIKNVTLENRFNDKKHRIIPKLPVIGGGVEDSKFWMYGNKEDLVVSSDGYYSHETGIGAAAAIAKDCFGNVISAAVFKFRPGKLLSSDTEAAGLLVAIDIVVEEAIQKCVRFSYDIKRIVFASVFKSNVTAMKRRKPNLDTMRGVIIQSCKERRKDLTKRGYKTEFVHIGKSANGLPDGIAESCIDCLGPGELYIFGLPENHQNLDYINIFDDLDREKGKLPSRGGSENKSLP